MLVSALGRECWISAVRLFGERRMVAELRVLFTREQIAARVAELGRQISQDFAVEPVVLVRVLKGAVAPAHMETRSCPSFRKR